MVYLVPPMISMLGAIAVLALILGFIFWGIRKINSVVASRRIRRKLAAASMAGEQIQK